MTTYYANSQSGDDTNNGTSAITPFKTAQYAAEMMSNGDTLMLDAPATEPFRGGMEVSAAGTYRGTSATEQAYLTGMVNVSHGTAIDNLLRNGDCEAWIDATEPWAISTSGDDIARSTDSHGGTYSLRATKNGATIYLSWRPELSAGVSVDFSYWHKDSVAGRWKFYVRENDPDPDNYLQADGSWAAGSYLFDPNDFNAAWHSYSKTFTTNGAGNYSIIMTQPYAEALYLDDAVLEYTGIATYQWSNVVGKNYKVLNIPLAFQPRIVLKSSGADWTASGMEALELVTLAASLVACDSTPGSWFYDTTTDLVYYCPAAGEDVTTIHLELGQPITHPAGDEVYGVAMIAADDVALRNLRVYGGNRHLVMSDVGTTGGDLYYVDAKFVYSCGVYVEGNSDITASNCTASWGHEGFFSATSGSLLTADSCTAEYAEDDGFQSADGGDMVLTRCVSRLNGRELSTNNSGFSVEGINTSGTLYNCTAYGNYGRGIDHNATGVGSVLVRNCISYGTVLSSDSDAHITVGFSAFTHDHNVFGGHGALWVLDATEQIADPLFVNPPSVLTLQFTSPAIEAGIDVGLPYNYTAPDCGAYEYAICGGALELAEGETYRVWNSDNKDTCHGILRRPFAVWNPPTWT